MLVLALVKWERGLPTKPVDTQLKMEFIYLKIKRKKNGLTIFSFQEDAKILTHLIEAKMPSIVTHNIILYASKEESKAVAIKQQAIDGKRHHCFRDINVCKKGHVLEWMNG